MTKAEKVWKCNPLLLYIYLRLVSIQSTANLCFISFSRSLRSQSVISLLCTCQNAIRTGTVGMVITVSRNTAILASAANVSAYRKLTVLKTTAMLLTAIRIAR